MVFGVHLNRCLKRVASSEKEFCPVLALGEYDSFASTPEDLMLRMN